MHGLRLADPAVLEFDHVGPKTMEVGKLVREAYRLERVIAEIANCELADYLRSAPCVDCSEADLAVLDFDHVGVKRYGVVQLAYREASIASIEREIAECEVRCANGHRRRTIVQQGQFRNHLLTPP